MEPLQEIQKFGNLNNCKHDECQRIARVGMDIQPTIQCMIDIPTLEPSTVFMENVVEMAQALSQIMVLCGIHECKAKVATDVTTYAFLHYEQVCFCLDNLPKKIMRKDDVFHELGRKCLMNRVEAHLAYSIIQRGFKAFYYKMPETQLDEEEDPISFSEECVYEHAAKKTAESYARHEGLSCSEQLGYENKMKVIYQKLYDRINSRLDQESEECQCCFCDKKGRHQVYCKESQSEQSEKPKKNVQKCPHCCKKGKRTFAAQAQDKCSECHRLKRYCICPKYNFMLDWVRSIWDRPDWAEYCVNMEKEGELKRAVCDGNSWFAL